ncbi:MAG: dual specificity protein phosphatase family protein [Gemmataceae bacterium]
MRQIPGYSLWIGHVGDTWDLRGVLNAGILAVVDLAVNEPPAAVTRELAYLRFPLVDGTGNATWLLRSAVEAVTGLIRSQTPTLVYCSNGLSRSVCIAAAALAKTRQFSPTDGMRLVGGTGPADVSPRLWTEIVESVFGNDGIIRPRDLVGEAGEDLP